MPELRVRNHSYRPASVRAFTLVELMVVIAILLLLAAILFPTYNRAVVSSQKTDEMSRMHQIGLAAELYNQEMGAYPTRLDILVNSGRIPSEICFSSRDSYKRGLANEVMASLAVNVWAPRLHAFRASFLAYGDFGYTYDRYPEVLTAEGGGWLVNLLDSKQGHAMEPSTWSGKYQRLRFDGSVITRDHHKWVAQQGNSTGYMSSPHLLYQEPTKEWIDKLQE